jgi:hypothetical protein
MAMDSELSAFSAWSLLSLTATAPGVLAYPDELGVRYVYDNTVPNGRYVAVGDLAVIRDNRYVFGAGWIDSIEESDASKCCVLATLGSAAADCLYVSSVLPLKRHPRSLDVKRQAYFRGGTRRLTRRRGCGS